MYYPASTVASGSWTFAYWLLRHWCGLPFLALGAWAAQSLFDRDMCASRSSRLYESSGENEVDGLPPAPDGAKQSPPACLSGRPFRQNSGT